MTVDTSPDPGRKPTPQEAEAAIRMADKGDVVFNIVDIRDAFWAEAFTGKLSQVGSFATTRLAEVSLAS